MPERSEHQPGCTALPRPSTGIGAVVALSLLVGLTPLLFGFDLLRSENDDVREGNELLAEGKPDDALEAYARAAALHPTSPILALDRGLAYYGMEDWARARDELLRATAAASPVVRCDGFFDLGNAYFKMEDYAAAIEAYKRSLLINYAREDAKWNLELAIRMLEEKKKDEPESKPSEEPESKPGDPESDSPESKPSEPESGEEPPPPEDGEKDDGRPEAEPTPSGLDPKTVLDALKDREKAVKKEERMKALGIRPRSVEKDW